MLYNKLVCTLKFVGNDMNEYPILFTEKYLDDKFSFNDFAVPNVDAKIKVLQQWETEIRNRTIYSKKEEQLQADFLNDIFGEVLGYAYKRGLKEYNLEKEEKSKTDGTKPDGVLGFLTVESKDIRVVIELKDAYTNLDHKQNRKNDNRTPVEQAFSYVAKSGGNCKWVVVSNFIEIRLYPANDSSFYQRFMVKDLVRLDVLKYFYALLSNGNLFCQTSESVVDKLLQHKIEADTKITKEFYNDYRRCRTALFNHIKENNPSVDDNTALSKSQKILDRIIFICFCEDIGLLPYKVFKIILEEAKSSRFDVRETKLWARTKALFSMIDKGYPTENINRFNGGLFKDDEIIDNFVIKDSVLADIIALESYDFESDLNVNILGHIFEQSITDLEELKASFKGETIDKKKGKRKKDGIFYTPEYITKYIVSEAVGGWLEDKKRELGYDDLPKIDEEQWIRIRKGNIQKNNQTIKKHLDFWLKYREVLNNIKVLDPACGSGSFLVQVFTYLKEQSRLVKEEIATLQGLQPDLFNEDSHILSHNIYGVDLNPESVEITKLALWLKTANKSDPLTSLDDNIKCGNSLVNDATIDAEHAFDWSKEFPEIMNSGGFDVVVGNPPYFNIDTFGNSSPMFEHLKNRYADIYMDKSDILFYFIYKAISLVKNSSYVSYIVSNAFLFSDKARRLRNYLIAHTSLKKIVNFEKHYIFKDANITTLIFSLVKERAYTGTKVLSLRDNNYKQSEIENIVANEHSFYEIRFDSDSPFALANPLIDKINKKIDKDKVRLGSILKVGKGMETSADKVFLFNKYPNQFPQKFIKKRISGENINRYNINPESDFILYFEDIDNFEDLPPSIQQHLFKHREKLENRADKKRRKTSKWWNYTFPIHKEYYDYDKLYCSRRSKNNIFCYETGFEYLGFSNMTIIFDTNKEYSLKYILSLLNSKCLDFRYKSIGKQTGSGVFEYFENQVSQLPIPEISLKQQQPFIELADIMLAKNKELQELSTKFINILKGDFKDVIINNALTNWYELEWNGFINALKKQKIVLSGTLKDDWYDRFNRFANEIKEINAIINDTDKKIDAEVYKLYNLTDAEIKVIEEQS